MKPETGTITSNVAELIALEHLYQFVAMPGMNLDENERPVLRRFINSITEQRREAVETFGKGNTEAPVEITANDDELYVLSYFLYYRDEYQTELGEETMDHLGTIEESMRVEMERRDEVNR